MTFIKSMDIGARGKNPSVKIMCFIFSFSFFHPGQVCKQEDGFEQCSNCTLYVIKYIQTIRNTTCISKVCNS